MKRLTWIGAFVVCGLFAGCATSQMKSTPFYTGEGAAYTGKIEDRVNLWPFAYYREPALSVLWPFFSLTDDHLAVRPIYSQFRQGGKDSAYDEYNFLWPLCQFDTYHHANRIFPVFWDDDSLTVFPFVWWRKDNYFKIFPIWGSTPNSQMLFPLYYRDPERFITPLFGYSKNSSWFFPFYYKDRDTFASVFLASGRSGDTSYWMIPPLLSYRETSPTHSLTSVLCGLGGYSKGPHDQYKRWLFPFYYEDDSSFKTPLFGWNFDSSWCVPFYYKDDNSFVSLPYISSRSEEASYWMIPPLLSYGKTSPTHSLTALLGGLGGYSKGPDDKYDRWLMPFYYQNESSIKTPLFGYDRRRQGSWLFPFYYKDKDNFLSLAYWRTASTDENGNRSISHGTFPFWYANDQSFYSPFWISKDADEYSWTMPLTLSWGRSSATDYSNYYLLGLSGFSRARTGAYRDWIAPLYYRDDSSFISLPWSCWKTEKGSEYAIAPLMTYFNSRGDFITPLGGKLKDFAWAFPLGWKNTEGFMTPFYGEKQKGNHTTHYLPFLLSKWTSATKDFRSVRVLGGLGGWKQTKEYHTSWLFPFWYKEGDAFFSLPFIHANGTTSIALIMGMGQNERCSDVWLWPLVWWIRDKQMSEAEAMMNAEELDSKVSVCWKGTIDGDYTNQYTTIKGEVSAEDSVSFLCGLGGGEHKIDWSVQESSSENQENRIVANERWNYGNRLLLKREGHRSVSFDAETHRKVNETKRTESGLFLNLLWHAKQDLDTDGHEHTMKSLLWRLWHYERQDGEVSVDSFPFFTYDKKSNGYAKTSLVWRLFRHEYDPEKGRKVDLLFLPVWR